MRFPPEKIDEVRDASDIVDLIGSYVKLTKRGKNYVGLCPFHTEKTPSFSVSVEKQMFYCFGCQKGGNVFTFLMELEKVSFQEAVRTLANRAGIALPLSSSADDTTASEAEALYQACSEAARFFHYNLVSTTEGKLALEYFRYRGFSDATVTKFGLGYSLNSWDALVTYAASQGIPMDVLEKGGLVRRREDGGVYDYFRGRAMFPIFSPSGRVVGFGARKVREDDPIEAKYINSPETLIYNKSKTLYGLFQTKEAIREKESALLVEGYADLITLYQSGICNVVATSGTALTVEQIQLLSRYTKQVTIVYDADSAGSKAALRGVDLLLEQDVDVRITRLPRGDDPDSYVKAHGKEAFEEVIAKAISFVEFIASAYEEEGKFSTPEGQAQAVRGIVQAIARIPDELKRQFYVKQVAEKYKLYETVLYRELEKRIGQHRRESTRTWTQPVGGGQGDSTDRQMPERAQYRENDDIPAAERDLLHVMLEGGISTTDAVLNEVDVEDFTHPKARALAALIRDTRDVEGTVDPSHLMTTIEDLALKQLIVRLVFSKYELSKGWRETVGEIEEADPQLVLRDALLAFRRRSLEKRIEENQRLLKSATERGEDVMPLLARRQELLAELKALTPRAAASP